MVHRKTISGLSLLAIAGAAWVLMSFGSAFAQQKQSSGTGGQSKELVLLTGTYTAKVKAIVCGMCGPLIQKTLQDFKEVGAVTVDQKTSTVQFSIKKGSMINLSALQKSLDAAAKSMGMGADYALSDVKPK